MKLTDNDREAFDQAAKLGGSSSFRHLPDGGTADEINALNRALYDKFQEHRHGWDISFTGFKPGNPFSGELQKVARERGWNVWRVQSAQFTAYRKADRRFLEHDISVGDDDLLNSNRAVLELMLESELALFKQAVEREGVAAG